MRYNSLTNLLRTSAWSALALLLILFSTGLLLANPVKTISNLNGLAGTWQLKRTFMEKNNNQIKVLLPVSETPQSLILAVEEGTDEITINEGYRDFIQTQTLSTNGQMVTKNFQQIGKASTRAFWQNGSLVVEVLTLKGDKLTEIFEISSNQKQLKVILQFTAAGTAQTTKVRRIYQRIIAVEENNTAQVGITNYPL